MGYEKIRRPVLTPGTQMQLGKAVDTGRLGPNGKPILSYTVAVAAGPHWDDPSIVINLPSNVGVVLDFRLSLQNSANAYAGGSIGGIPTEEWSANLQLTPTKQLILNTNSGDYRTSSGYFTIEYTAA